MSKISELIFAGAYHKITSPYGPRGGSFHYGTDYGTNLKNLPQYAIEDGEVYSKGYEANAAGYYVWVKYPRINKRFLHCHLQKPVTLNKGDHVTRGTLLGYTGTTGNSTGIHLHLGVRDLTTNAYEDPEKFAQTYQDPVIAQPLSGEPVRLQIGYASPGDVRTFNTLLVELVIPYTEQDGYLITDVPVSSGDQVSIVALGATLGVPVVIYEEKQPEPEQTDELEQQIAELKAENAALVERVQELENKIAAAQAALA